MNLYHTICKWISAFVIIGFIKSSITITSLVLLSTLMQNWFQVLSRFYEAYLILNFSLNTNKYWLLFYFDKLCLQKIKKYFLGELKLLEQMYFLESNFFWKDYKHVFQNRNSCCV